MVRYGQNEHRHTHSNRRPKITMDYGFNEGIVSPELCDKGNLWKFFIFILCLRSFINVLHLQSDGI